MPDAVDFLIERFKAAGDKIAFIEGDTSATYADLLDRIATCDAALADAGVPRHASVQLRGDFGLASAAWLIALWARHAIVTPVAPTSFEKADEFADVAQVAFKVEEDTITPFSGASDCELYARLRADDHAGLIIFSSGTTGTSKGALHDVNRLLTKFHSPGKDLRTLAFLLFDHIAGIDTLLYCLSNASTIVCTTDRSPAAVAELIEAHGVEVLPTAPSFLNMMLLTGAVARHDLSSLRIVTYGAEMMPQSLLERIGAALPGTVRLIQKYGTSEIGALKSRSENNASRWIDLGPEGETWRIRDGLLEVKTKAAMLGYLNAPSPFTEDGWYKTGDQVEVRGNLVQFQGRDSDIINVGGQKVFPAEVENAIRALEGVEDVAVFGKPHPMLGATVCAKIRMHDPDATPAQVRVALRQGLAGVLEPYKIPQKIELTTEALSTDRFKQQRG
ncbi:MAG: fatty acid--CoA ligase family protein [Pseudomonadota bacterium]